MKKFLVLILSILYLGSTVGATVNLHFCMDELVSWGIGHDEHGDSGLCDSCGMMKPGQNDNGCCKDEQRRVKIENDHKGVQTFKQQPLIYIAVVPAYFEMQESNCTIAAHHVLTSYVPLRSWDKNLYKIICVFRI